MVCKIRFYEKEIMFSIGFGLIIIIAGLVVFNNLTRINAVDSYRWPIRVIGFESFQWPVFTGVVFIVIGIIFYIAHFDNSGKMID